MRVHIVLFLLSLSLPLRCFCAPSSTSDFTRMAGELTRSSLPLVNLDVDTVAMGKETPRDAVLTIAEPSRSERPQLRCQVHYRGGGTLSLNKKSFSMTLLDENGEERDTALFALREAHSYILDAMAYDRARMRNRVCFDLWNEFSGTPYTTDYDNRNGTKGLMVELFINGNWHGVYCLTDKINRKLLALKKTKSADKPRGVLYKSFTHGVTSHLESYGADWPLDSETWGCWELKQPEDMPSPQAWKPLLDIIDFFAGTDYDAIAAKLDEFIWVDNWVDYALLFYITALRDNNIKNTYLSSRDISSGEHKLLITPWDMDGSLGAESNGRYNTTILSHQSQLLREAKPYKVLLDHNVGGFKDRLKQRWTVLRDSTLSPSNVSRLLDLYERQLTNSGAWQREVQRWNNDPLPLNEDLAKETQIIKDWYANAHSQLQNILFPNTDPVESDEWTVATLASVYFIILGLEEPDERFDVNEETGSPPLPTPR